MFDLEKFRTGDCYVSLPTRELYDEAMKFLSDNGFVWADGNLLEHSDKWSYYGTLTSIIGWGDDTVKFASVITCMANYYERLDIDGEFIEGQCKFTQEEIERLPIQEFVQSLIKEE